MIGSPLVVGPVESHNSHAKSRCEVIELLVGGFLLGAATLAGLAFVHRPWPNRVDTIGLRLFAADWSSGWANDVVRLGSTPFLVACIVALCFIALVRRDRGMALVCLVAPLGAVLVVELVAKPLVGRHLYGSTALSFPSGTVTAVAALATGAFLVAPWVLRPIVAVAGGLAVAAICAAVVVLRWHYPSDAPRRSVCRRRRRAGSQRRPPPRLPGRWSPPSR